MTVYLRCRVCGHEPEAEDGPEAFSIVTQRLADHIRAHTDAELAAYVLRDHSVPLVEKVAR